MSGRRYTDKYKAEAGTFASEWLFVLPVGQCHSVVHTRTVGRLHSSLREVGLRDYLLTHRFGSTQSRSTPPDAQSSA